MQVKTTLFAIAAILVVSIESKPTWSSYHVQNYPAEVVSLEPQVVHVEEIHHIPYIFPHAHTDLNTATVFGKLEVPSLHSFYYGPSVYDFRFPLTPVFPVLKTKPVTPSKPTPPTTTEKPKKEGDNGIEKLDTKVEPEEETKKDSDKENDSAKKDDSDKEKDSIIVESA